MRKFTIISLISACVLLIGLTFNACEGPAGPEGAAGQDANATCTKCHNNESKLIAKTGQWMNSQHAIGETTFETRTTCAVCHTSEGYMERMAAGKSATAAEIMDPTTIGCRTCHNIHEAYDTTDWNLKYSANVVLWADSSTTLSYGSGNVCINCHQARVANPSVASIAAATSTVSISSSRWGYHHGPQSGVMAGKLGYSFGNDVAVSAHKNVENGCVDCHMAKAVGNLGGGHTFKVAFEEEGEPTLNTAGCTSCHSANELDPSKAEYIIEPFQEEIDGMLTQLHDIFVSKGYLDANTGLWKASSSNKLTVTKDEAGAMLNYNLIAEDRSRGVHNPKYAKALLQYSLAVFAVK